MQAGTEHFKNSKPQFDINFRPHPGARRAELENYLYRVYQTAQYPTEITPTKRPSIPKTCSPLLLLGISLFLMLDAWLSVSLLNMGHTSTLSLAQIFARADFAFFFLIKSIVTASFLAAVAIYRHYIPLKRLTGKRLLTLASFAYALLLIYEMSLIS